MDLERKLKVTLMTKKIGLGQNERRFIIARAFVALATILLVGLGANKAAAEGESEDMPMEGMHTEEMREGEMPHQNMYGMPGHGPCHDEVQKLCSGVKPGEGQIRKCIKENKDKFSDECKTRMAEIKEQAKEMKGECAADAKTICGGKKRKELRKCLKENMAKLSPACKASVQAVRKSRK